MAQNQTQIQEQEHQRRTARAANLAAFGLTAVLTTDEAAAVLNRQPQTLRKWACLECGPIRPVRINGRLGWRVADLEKLLSGEPQNAKPPKVAPTDPRQSEHDTQVTQSRGKAMSVDA